MSSPLLWGPNNTSNNLQNKIQLATGAFLGTGLDAWAASTAYIVGQQVVYGQAIYSCLTAHTSSSTMESDLAGTSPKWKLVNTQPNIQNLMTYGFDFECGDVAGWTAVGCATVTNGLLVSAGSGGAAFSAANGGRTKGANTTSPAVVSSGQLDGSYSLNFATSGAGTIGDMYISSTYKIPIAYQSTVLQVKFKYKVVSGTPVMSGTSSNTYACAIYDIDNNSWSTMALVGAFNFVQSSGVGTFTGTFQVPYNSTQFQIAIYNPIAPTGSSSLYVDDFYVGPQITTTGPMISDMGSKSWTPTGSWTSNVTYTGKYQQVGDMLKGYVLITCSGAPTAATLTVNLPSGLTIDTNKIVSAGIDSQYYGSGIILDSGTAAYIPVFVGPSGTTTSVGVSIGSTGGTYGGKTAVTNLIPFTFGLNDTVSISFSVPISGWSSNTVMSSDTDTRVVACSRACGTQISVPTLVYTYIDFTTNNLDTHSAWRAGVGYNSGTGAWTTSPGYVVPVSGIYHITTNILYPGAANSKQVYIVKNGFAIGNAANDVTQSSNTTLTATATYSFVAGDIIGVQLWQTSGGALTVPGSISSYWSHIEIQRLSGPAVIAATDTVSALYVPTTVPTGTLAAAWNFVTFNTKIKDSHGAYSGNTYTIPVTGQWDISSYFSITATYTAGAILGIGISIDGVTNPTYSRAPRIAGSTTNPIGVDIEIKSVPLKAGQTVKIMVYCSAASASFESASGAHQFSIVRSGNY